MIAHAVFSSVQLGIQVILAVGGGAVLWWLLRRPALELENAWLWLGLAGVTVPALLLQSLVYFGLPLRLTAGPVFGLAPLAAACAGPGIWRSLRTNRILRTNVFSQAAVFMAVIATQAVGLITVGPARYHGAGHYDQATYVVTTQFLMDEPFATKIEDMGYRPWMLRAFDMKPGRITGMIMLGSVAVVSHVDAQQAYGVVNVFFVGLLALAVAGMAATFGLPRWASCGAALLAGCAPAVTRIHLDGFFSQATSLFVFPALVGVLGGALGSRQLRIGCAALLLALLIGTYSELTPFGVLFVGVLQAVAPGSLRQRAVDLILIVGLSLLVNPGYVGRLVIYLFSQAPSAQNPANLAALFPDSGSWAGWGRYFFESESAEVATGVGVAVAVLILTGCIGLVRRRQFALPAGVTVAAAVLGYLRWGGEFHPYVFAKLGIEFIGIWAVGIAAGLFLLPGAGRAAQVWKAGALAALVLGAGITAFPRQAVVMFPTGRLAVLSSEHLARIRDETAAHPERIYLVASNDPLVAEWLCYFGRHSAVVLDRRTMGDRLVTTENNPCRRWLGPRDALWWLDPDRSGPVENYEPAPAFAFKGSIETAGDVGSRHYVAGRSTEIELTADSFGRRRHVWLDFVLVPLAPGQVLDLQCPDGEGNVIRRRIDRAGWVRLPLTIGAGRNSFPLTVEPVASPAAAEGETGVFLLKLPSVEVSPDLPQVDGATPTFL